MLWVNRAWQEAENWCRGRLTIKPQSFHSLKQGSRKQFLIDQANLAMEEGMKSWGGLTVVHI